MNEGNVQKRAVLAALLLVLVLLVSACAPAAPAAAPTGDTGAGPYLARHGATPVECGDLWSGEDRDRR